MSVSQIIEELNCTVLMYPTFCLLQDILSKEIVGRGTKKGGLYYLDDFSLGIANHVHHQISSKERQIWLWHQRLGIHLLAIYDIYFLIYFLVCNL